MAPQATLGDYGRPRRSHKDASDLRELYVGKEMTVQEIADHFDKSVSTIHYWLEKHGIDRRKRSWSGWEHPRMERYARYQMKTDGHMKWVNDYDGEREEVFVHRLLAVSEHGVDAVADNIVHHKNSIPWDNRPENLELMSRSEHSRVHQEARVRMKPVYE